MTEQGVDDSRMVMTKQGSTTEQEGHEKAEITMNWPIKDLKAITG